MIKVWIFAFITLNVLNIHSLVPARLRSFLGTSRHFSHILLCHVGCEGRYNEYQLVIARVLGLRKRNQGTGQESKEANGNP